MGNLTLGHAMEGLIWAMVSGGFSALGASLVDAQNFNLFTNAGIEHAATLFFGGALVGGGIYLRGLYQRAPSDQWDGKTERRESDIKDGAQESPKP